MIRRGFSRAHTKSARVLVPTKRLPAFWATKASIAGVSRFQTATEKPWSWMLRARFRRLTARPFIPKSALALIFVLLLLPGRVRGQKTHELLDQPLLVVTRVALAEEAFDALPDEALPRLLFGPGVDGEEQRAHVAGR